MGAFKVVISLEVERVVTVEGLPFVCNFVKSFSGDVGLYTVVLSGGLKSGLDVFYGSLDCLLDSLKSVQNIESEIVSECFG